MSEAAEATEDDTGSLWIHQLLASFFLFSVTLAGGTAGPAFLARCYKRHPNSNSVPATSKEDAVSFCVEVMRAFSGGCLMALIMVRLWPAEVSGHESAESGSGGQYGGVLVLAGLLCLLWTEYLASRCKAKPLEKDKKRSPYLRDDEEDITKELMTGSTSKSINRASVPPPPSPTSVFPFLFSVGLHSFLEGFALAAQDSVSSLWSLAATFAAHKWIIAMALSASIMRQANVKFLRILVVSTLFSVATPAGCLTGASILALAAETSSASRISSVMGPLAVGSLLYVAVFELSSKAAAGGGKEGSLWPIASLTAGAAGVTVLLAVV